MIGLVFSKFHSALGQSILPILEILSFGIAVFMAPFLLPESKKMTNTPETPFGVLRHFVVVVVFLFKQVTVPSALWFSVYIWLSYW